MSSHCVIFQLEEDFFFQLLHRERTHHPITVTARKRTPHPSPTMTWTTMAIRLLFQQPYRQHMAKYLRTAGLVIGSCLLCLLRQCLKLPRRHPKIHPKLALEKFQLLDEEVKLSQNLLSALSKTSGHFVFCVLMLQIRVAVSLSLDFNVSRPHIWIFVPFTCYTPGV